MLYKDIYTKPMSMRTHIIYFIYLTKSRILFGLHFTLKFYNIIICILACSIYTQQKYNTYTESRERNVGAV